MTNRLTLLEKMDRLLLRELKGWGRKRATHYESRELWTLLTALRGPDQGSNAHSGLDKMRAKRYTTGVIRGAMPGFAFLSKDNQAIVGLGYPYCLECAAEGGPHFEGHSNRAARRLNINTGLCVHHQRVANELEALNGKA